MLENSDTLARNPRAGRNGREPPVEKRWKKGQSGNPGGRPKKKIDSEKTAQEHAEEAIAALVEVMTNPKAAAVARVSAAQAILDRGFGRPTQAIKAEHSLSSEFETLLADINEERKQERIARSRSEREVGAALKVIDHVDD